MDWQVIIASLIVLAAACWLTRRVWQTIAMGLSGDAKVSNCGNCPQNPAVSNEPEVLPLEQLGSNQGQEY